MNRGNLNGEGEVPGKGTEGGASHLTPCKGGVGKYRGVGGDMVFPEISQNTEGLPEAFVIFKSQAGVVMRGRGGSATESWRICPLTQCITPLPHPTHAKRRSIEEGHMWVGKRKGGKLVWREGAWARRGAPQNGTKYAHP